MKMRKINAVLLTLLVIIVFYVIATSIERVPSGEVEVVMQLSIVESELTLKPRPLVNPAERGKWFLKQPKIPFSGIGYLKESFSINATMDFSTSFAYYTLDQITGQRSDRETVSACIIDGRIEEITDWELFISRLDPDRYNSDDNPYGLKYRSRPEIMADQIKFLVRSGDPGSLYPGLVSNKEEVPTPAQKIEYWYQELISRRNFIVALKDRFDFESEEQWISFLQNESPWYWGLGVQQFETLLNQADDMAEYLQSSYSEGLSARGYAGRYLGDEDFILLVNMVNRVDNWERSMADTENNIRNMQSYYYEQYENLRSHDEKLARLLYWGYLEDIKERNMQLVDLRIEDLNDDFLQYFDTEVYNKLYAAIRRRKLELAMESLAEYELSVINNIRLDHRQQANVQQATDFLKIEYAGHMMSDNWENFSTTFTKELNSYLIENPETIMPEEQVIQMIYFRLLEYYLEQVLGRYGEQKINSSELLLSLYGDLVRNPILLNSNSSNMSNLITDYLMNDDSLLIRTAGSLIGIEWNLNHQIEQKERLMDIKKNVLVPYFTHMMKDENLAESEELWLTAIEDVISGEDLAEHHVTYSHKVREGETLETISGLYGIDGRDLLRHTHSAILFELPGEQGVFDFLNSFRSIDYVYKRVKEMPLRTAELITLDTVPPYTEDWWETRSIEQNQRSMIMKSFIYTWIDQHLPEAFSEFAEESPYIDYLETYFGITISDLSLRIEPRSVYSNEKIRQVDPDFLNVYSGD